MHLLSILLVVFLWDYCLEYILVSLLKDARRSAGEIANELGVSKPTVLDNIKWMTKEGIIKGYRVMIDVEKLDYKRYLMLVDCKILDREKVAKRIFNLKESSYHMIIDAPKGGKK